MVDKSLQPRGHARLGGGRRKVKRTMARLESLVAK